MTVLYCFMILPENYIIVFVRHPWVFTETQLSDTGWTTSDGLDQIDDDIETMNQVLTRGFRDEIVQILVIWFLFREKALINFLTIPKQCSPKDLCSFF